jgi:hypothetical protein
MPVPPRHIGIDLSAIMLQQRQGTWGLYLHETPSASTIAIAAIAALGGQKAPKDFTATTITPLNDAPLVVRSQFLEHSESFVENVLALMAEARAAAAPALEAGDRALAMLGVSMEQVARLGTLGTTPQVSVTGPDETARLGAARVARKRWT